MGNTILWAVLIVVFLVTEAVTYQMITTWFAVGASVAAVLSAMGVSFWWQITAFVVVSVLCFAALRPLALRCLKATGFKSNADGLVGERLIVSEDINNILGTGNGKINGVEWSLRSENGEIIPSGSLVQVVRINGVRLMVEHIKEEN